MSNFRDNIEISCYINAGLFVALRQYYFIKLGTGRSLNMMLFGLIDLVDDEGPVRETIACRYTG